MFKEDEVGEQPDHDPAVELKKKVRETSQAIFWSFAVSQGKLEVTSQVAELISYYLPNLYFGDPGNQPERDAVEALLVAQINEMMTGVVGVDDAWALTASTLEKTYSFLPTAMADKFAKLMTGGETRFHAPIAVLTAQANARPSGDDELSVAFEKIPAGQGVNRAAKNAVTEFRSGYEKSQQNNSEKRFSELLKQVVFHILEKDEEYLIKTEGGRGKYKPKPDNLRNHDWSDVKSKFDHWESYFFHFVVEHTADHIEKFPPPLRDIFNDLSGPNFGPSDVQIEGVEHTPARDFFEFLVDEVIKHDLHKHAVEQYQFRRTDTLPPNANISLYLFSPGQDLRHEVTKLCRVYQVYEYYHGKRVEATKLNQHRAWQKLVAFFGKYEPEYFTKTPSTLNLPENYVYRGALAVVYQQTPKVMDKEKEVRVIY